MGFVSDQWIKKVNDWGAQVVTLFSVNKVRGEVPAVTQALKKFTCAHTPDAGTLCVYVLGTRVKNTDFALAGAVITFVNTLAIGATVWVDYDYKTGN